MRLCPYCDGNLHLTKEESGFSLSCENCGCTAHGKTKEECLFELFPDNQLLGNIVEIQHFY